MKYLDIPELEDLNAFLARVDLPDARLYSRIEIYSCKNTDADNKLKQHLKRKYPLQDESLLYTGNHNTSDLPMSTSAHAFSKSAGGLSNKETPVSIRNTTAKSPIVVPSSSSRTGTNPSDNVRLSVQTQIDAIHRQSPGLASAASYHSYLSPSFSKSIEQQNVFSYTNSTIRLGNYSVSPIGLEHTAAALSSPVSPIGPISEAQSRKMLFLLLATLNASFPDYDFSDIQPSRFSRIPQLSLLTTQIQSFIFPLNHTELTQTFKLKIWSVLDPDICLEDCEFYVFHPPSDQGPDVEEGNLWSFYYFLYNKKLKRMAFITCRLVSALNRLRSHRSLSSVPFTDVTGEDTMNREYSPSIEEEGSLTYDQFTMENIEV